MSAASAIQPANETKWTVISGSMSGTVRLMKLHAFTIGRSPECEFIIIDDPKCSRRHAEVRWTAQGCEIIGMNDKNPLLINGREVERAVLADEDVIVLGNTEVRFNLTSLSTSASVSVSASAARPERKPSGATQITLMPKPEAPVHASESGSSYTRRDPPQAKRSPRSYIIFGVVGLLAVGLFMLPSTKKKAELALRTEAQIQADIDAANKMNEAAQASTIKRVDQTITSRQAQENFVRGFRDYRKGQFERSMDSFQACLALSPGHVLCNRYIRLAQRRFNELVQYNIVLGRKYRDQSQFQACRSAFRNVMVMVKDPTTATYREAKANYDACNSLSEDRF